MTEVRRGAIGSSAALAAIAVLSLVMVPLRDHLSLATPALVLVVPVVLGVAMGGLVAGVVAVTAGFIAYDLVFIPPYYSLTVGDADNWVPLGVYVVVMLVVARVVVFLQDARAEARRHEDDTRRLFALSDQLIGDRPLPELLELVVTTIERSFAPTWVALLLPTDPEGANLAVAATAGATIPDEERAGLVPSGGELQSLGSGAHGDLTRVVLTAATRPVGLLVMAGVVLADHDRALLYTYANQAALAVDQNRLRVQARRSELLEEVDRLRRALMGAVSHDLRTPLASVKAAVSALRRPDLALQANDRAELLELIEQQSDTLARLVTNLLDMTRIESGALELRVEACSLSEIVEDAIVTLGTVAGPHLVAVTMPPDLPLVAVDQTLVTQVVANLLDNALRHSPPGLAVEVAAHSLLSHEGDSEVDGAHRPSEPLGGGIPTGPRGGGLPTEARGGGIPTEPRGGGIPTEPGGVALTVTDRGPGVPAVDRDRIFEMFSRSDGGGRAGLGLAIARSFVEVHGERIWVEDAPGGGARFTLTLPVARVPVDAL